MLDLAVADPEQKRQTNDVDTPETSAAELSPLPPDQAALDKCLDRQTDEQLAQVIRGFLERGTRELAMAVKFSPAELRERVRASLTDDERAAFDRLAKWPMRVGGVPAQLFIILVACDLEDQRAAEPKP